MEAQEMDNAPTIITLTYQFVLKTNEQKVLPSLEEEKIIPEWRLFSPLLSDHENYGETSQGNIRPLEIFRNEPLMPWNFLPFQLFGLMHLR